MSEPVPDPIPDPPPDPMPDPEPEAPADAGALSFPDMLAALGLPTDAKAIVMTAETVVAIAADYPEPHEPPVEVPNADDE